MDHRPEPRKEQRVKTLYRNETLSLGEFELFAGSAQETFSWVLKLENSGEIQAGYDNKRTGCVVVLGTARGDIQCVIALGTLSADDEANYFGVATEKMQRLVREPNTCTSFPTAATTKRRYGGALCDLRSDTIISTSGLSAFGDETVSGGTGYHMARFTRDFVCTAMQASANPFLSKFIERTSTMAI